MSITGALAGFVTGLLTVVLQIPYTYYVFARTMKDAGSSWPVTLLATATVGNLAVLFTLPMIVINAPFSLFTFALKGWRDGIVSAIKSPYTIHTGSREFRRQHPLPAGMSIFSKIITELKNLGKAGSDALKINIQQDAKVQTANKIRRKYHRENSDAPTENLTLGGLTEEDYKDFSQAVTDMRKSLSEKQTYNITHIDRASVARNMRLEAYLNSKCPITDKSLFEIQKTTESVSSQEYEITADISTPVTIEFTNTEGIKTIYTYNYTAFEAQLFTDLEDMNKPKLYAVTYEQTLIPLDSKDIQIYRGYYKELDANHIRLVIQTWRLEKESKSHKPTPQPTIPTTPTHANTEPLIQQTSSTQAKTVRDAWNLKFLDKPPLRKAATPNDQNPPNAGNTNGKNTP